MNKAYAKENIRYSHLSKPLQRSHLKPFKTLTFPYFFLKYLDINVQKQHG